jgi:hypothetical protein
VLDLVKGNSQIKIVDLSDGTARPIFATRTGSKQFISDPVINNNDELFISNMAQMQKIKYL